MVRWLTQMGLTTHSLAIYETMGDKNISSSEFYPKSNLWVAKNKKLYLYL